MANSTKMITQSKRFFIFASKINDSPVRRLPDSSDLSLDLERRFEDVEDVDDLRDLFRDDFGDREWRRDFFFFDLLMKFEIRA